MADDVTTLLDELLDAGVEFVVVGGIAAVVQGVPLSTFDLDVVHRRDADNVDRVLALVQTLHGYVRGHAEKRLPPSRAGLLGPGHCLLQTDRGALDLLGAIEEGLSYEGLLPHCISVPVGDRRVLVLSLEKMAELKSRSTRQKDKLALGLIRSTIAERKRRPSG